MSDLNQVFICGHLGADPEIRALARGGRVANLRLATSDSWRDKNTGERKERTEWHSIAVFNEGLIKVIEQYVKKGSRILLRGKLQTRKWQAQDGTDRYSTEIVLQPFDGFLQLLDSGGKNADAAGGSPARISGGSYGEAKGKAAPAAADYSRDIDDEVPF